MELCSLYSSGVINISGCLHSVCDRALEERRIPTNKIKKTVKVHVDWVICLQNATVSPNYY